VGMTNTGGFLDELTDRLSLRYILPPTVVETIGTNTKNNNERKENDKEPSLSSSIEEQENQQQRITTSRQEESEGRSRHQSVLTELRAGFSIDETGTNNDHNTNNNDDENENGGVETGMEVGYDDSLFMGRRIDRSSPSAKYQRRNQKTQQWQNHQIQRQQQRTQDEEDQVIDDPHDNDDHNDYDYSYGSPRHRGSAGGGNALHCDSQDTVQAANTQSPLPASILGGIVAAKLGEGVRLGMGLDAPAAVDANASAPEGGTDDSFQTANEEANEDDDTDKPDTTRDKLSTYIDDLLNRYKQRAADAKASGDWERALSMYSKAVVLAKPPSALLYANRAMAFEKLGRHKAAEQDCARALDINPDSAKALRVRGKLRYEHLGDKDGALSDLSQAQAIDFDPEVAEILKELTKGSFRDKKQSQGNNVDLAASQILTKLTNEEEHPTSNTNDEIDEGGTDGSNLVLSDNASIPPSDDPTESVPPTDVPNKYESSLSQAEVKDVPEYFGLSKADDDATTTNTAKSTVSTKTPIEVETVLEEDSSAASESTAPDKSMNSSDASPKMSQEPLAKATSSETTALPKAFGFDDESIERKSRVPMQNKRPPLFPNVTSKADCIDAAAAADESDSAVPTATAAFIQEQLRIPPFERKRSTDVSFQKPVVGQQRNDSENNSIHTVTIEFSRDYDTSGDERDMNSILTEDDTTVRSYRSTSRSEAARSLTLGRPPPMSPMTPRIDSTLKGRLPPAPLSAPAAMVRRPRFSFKRPKKANRLAEIIRKEIWSEDLMVVENVLLELAKLAEKESSTIARTGGLLAIVQIMEHHVDHPGIQVAACQALEKLALDHENEVAISEVGGLEAVIDSMMANFEDEKVHEAGWSALWNMTCQCSDPSIDMSEALQALTSSMVQHAQQPSVQRNACGTLANLCQPPERLDALRKAGGFVAIATALEDHWDDEDVRQEASHALSTLLESQVNAYDVNLMGESGYPVSPRYLETVPSCDPPEGC